MPLARRRFDGFVMTSAAAPLSAKRQPGRAVSLRMRSPGYPRGSRCGSTWQLGSICLLPESLQLEAAACWLLLASAAGAATLEQFVPWHDHRHMLHADSAAPEHERLHILSSKGTACMSTLQVPVPPARLGSRTSLTLKASTSWPQTYGKGVPERIFWPC